MLAVQDDFNCIALNLHVRQCQRQPLLLSSGDERRLAYGTLLMFSAQRYLQATHPEHKPLLRAVTDLLAFGSALFDSLQHPAKHDFSRHQNQPIDLGAV